MGYCVLATGDDASTPDADPAAPDASTPDADPAAPDAAGCAQGPTIPFSDDFNDNLFDVRWNDSTSGTSTIAEVNARLEMTLQPSPPGYNAELQTIDPGFDLTGLRVFVEVPQVLANNGQTRIRLLLDIGNNVVIRQQDGAISARYEDNVGTVTLASITYNSTAHRWWQIRETGGTLHFELSPDAIIWTSLATRATPTFISDVRVELLAGTSGQNAAPGLAHFDNLNVQPGCL